MAQIKSFSYKWREGSQHSVPVDVAASVTSELERQGRLTAKNLVDVSRPEDAPLHKEFEWNDSVAAEKYREDQARNIIGSIQIVYEEREPIKMYCHISKQEPGYMSVQCALSQPDTKEMLLSSALREMETFQKKYFQIAEFAKVFAAMDEVINQLKSA